MLTLYEKLVIKLPVEPKKDFSLRAIIGDPGTNLETNAVNFRAVSISNFISGEF